MSSSSIFFDDERNVYIDLDTGVEMPAIADFSNQHHSSTTSKGFENHFAYSYDPNDNQVNNHPVSSAQSTATSNAYDVEDPSAQLVSDHEIALRLAAAEAPAVPTQRRTNSVSPPVDNELTRAMMNLNLNDESQDSPPPGWGWEDWSLARALQSMEIEIAQEVNRGEAFENSEKQASSWYRQLLTVSTVICVAQIVIMIVMLVNGGIASQTVNPMIGPPPYILVKYGAKQMSPMVYKGQWWRFFTALFVHAGIWHILCNVIIQIRVGGYLNLMFGTPQWLAIYFTSGVFGYMLSGIFEVDTVGLGSSGAILGLITAWAVWIIFRWKKVPEIYHKQRNCQLGTVIVAVLVTIGLSFAPYVDWADNIGGVIQGLLWGAVALSHELENPTTKWVVRVAAFSISVLSFGLAAKALSEVQPSESLLEYFEAENAI